MANLQLSKRLTPVKQLAASCIRPIRRRPLVHVVIAVLLLSGLVLHRKHHHQRARRMAPETPWLLKTLKGKMLGPKRQRDFIDGPFVYFNETTAARLGCPVQDCHCFFKFGRDKAADTFQSVKNWVAPCSTKYKPVPMDKGQTWCQCNIAKQPEWLKKAHVLPWKHVKRGLLMAHMDGPNPTHQVNVTFLWIWLWLLHVAKLEAKQVQLIMDCVNPDGCLGRYGEGIAQALLSDPIYLPQLEQPLVVDSIKFSVGGTFPFSLWTHQPWLPHSPGYSNMVHAIKAHYNVPDRGLTVPLKIVITQRPSNFHLPSRVLTNAPELAAALQARGFATEVVVLGDLSFQDQVRAVQGASVLVGISGSDLVSAIFLPRNGALVEILPMNRGHQIVNVELHNMMRLAGKVYHRYHSPRDASLITVDGHIRGDTLLRQVGEVEVDIPSCVAVIEAAAMQAAFNETDRVEQVWHMSVPVNASHWPKPDWSPRRRWIG